MLPSKATQENNIIYKTEKLLSSSSNRYSITLRVANRANRQRYEDLDILTEPEIKPITRAIIEMADEAL